MTNPNVPSHTLDRAEAIEVVRLLNDLWGDILAGDGLFQLLEEHRIPFRSEAHLGYVQRMVFFHLAMMLCKLAEFHEKYSRFLSDESQLWLRGLYAKVRSTGLLDLRNKAIGHIIDEDTGRPLTGDQLDALFQRAVGGDSEQFCRWLRNKEDPGSLETVMGRVIWLRDLVMSEHGLTASDLGLDESSTRSYSDQ